MGQPSYDSFPSDDHVRWNLERAASLIRAGNIWLAGVHIGNGRHAAELVAMVEGRAFLPIPEFWFTYAGDAAARAGRPVKAGFLWPKYQREMRQTEEWKNRPVNRERRP